jgi:hypothetical protein
MLISVLHLIPDEDNPYAIVTRLMEAVPSGSWLARSHPARHVHPQQVTEAASRCNQLTSAKATLRTRAGRGSSRTARSACPGMTTLVMQLIAIDDIGAVAIGGRLYLEGRRWLCTGAGHRLAVPSSATGAVRRRVKRRLWVMAEVACFCGCFYSFDGGAGACPKCGEYASVTAAPASTIARPSQQGQPVAATNRNGQNGQNGLPADGCRERAEPSPELWPASRET